MIEKQVRTMAIAEKIASGGDWYISLWTADAKVWVQKTAACMLCQKAHEECGRSWNRELPKEIIGHIQSAGCLGQKEVVTAAHNACIRELLQEVIVHGKADRHMRLLTIETESRLGTLWDQEACNQFCSKEELWEAARDEEMKISWRAANEGPPVPEEQYQERFWRRRLDAIGLDTATKEFLAIEFKQTQDARSNYVERATAAAEAQYKSLLAGLQAVGQVKGWKVQQIVYVCGTCGSIHVESFNRNMKALVVLESTWDPIRKKLVRRLLEEQDKVLRSYFAPQGGTRSKGTGAIARAGNMSNGTCMHEDGARGSWPSGQLLPQWGA
jgi:hypothetical protein